MKKITVNLLVLFFIILNSLYLTNFLERSVIFSNYQFIFVFSYFIVINLFVFRFISKNIKNVEKKLIILILISSFFIIIAGGNYFDNHKFRDVSIDILGTGEKAQNSLGTEVWITAIEVDGKKMNLTEMGNSTWEYREGSLVNYKNQPSKLTLNLRYVSDIKMIFLKHQWSGIAKIKDKTVNLFSEQGNEFVYEFKPPIIVKNVYNYLDLLMAYLFVLSISLFLLILTKKNSVFFGFVSLGLYIFIYKVTEGLYLDKISSVVLIIISFLSGSIFLKKRFQEFLRNFIFSDKLSSVIFIIVSFLVSLFIFGNILFFASGFLEVTLQKIVLFGIVWMWCLPFIIIFLYSLEKVNIATKAISSTRTQKIRLFSLVTAIQIVVGLLMLNIYYPGNMTSDSIDQWKQAQGLLPISDAHPAFHTIVISLLSKIYNSTAFIVSVQILFAALVVSSVLMYLHKQGLKLSYVVVISSVFWLIPNNAVYIVTLWKDIPYTISLLWLTFLLLKLVQKQKVTPWYNIFALSIALGFVYLFRHNGIVPCILSLVAIVWYVFKSKRMYVLFVIPLTIIFIILIKGPLYSAFQVEEASNGLEFIAPIHGIASVIAHNGTLSEETAAYMKGIMPFEEWKRLYDPYNANPYMFGNNYSLTYKLSLSNTKDILLMYLDTLVRNPITVIYDRLTGIGLIWQTTQPLTGYNSRYVTTIVNNDIGLEAKGSMLTGVFNRILQATEQVTLVDSLIWRGGLPTIVMLLVLMFLLKKKYYAYLLALVPFIGNMISLVLSMSWQDYRYVYFEFFIIIFLLLALYLKKTNNIVGDVS